MQKVPPPDDGKVLNMLPTRKETSMCLYSQLSIYLAVYLSIDRSIYVPIYLSIRPSIYLSIHLSIFTSIHLSLSPSLPPSIHPSTYSAIHLSIYSSIHRSVYLSLSRSLPPSIHPSIHVIYRSICLSVCAQASLTTKPFCKASSIFDSDNMKNEAILQGFLHVRWLKTQQVCETSSMFELGNVKNERILRDFLQEWKVECRADGLVPMRFAIVPLHLSKVLRLPRRKSDAKSYQNAGPVSQNHLRKPEDLMLQNAAPLRKSAAWPLTSLMNMSLVLRLPREIHLCRSSLNV